MTIASVTDKQPIMRGIVLNLPAMADLGRFIQSSRGIRAAFEKAALWPELIRKYLGENVRIPRIIVLEGPKNLFRDLWFSIFPVRPKQKVHHTLLRADKHNCEQAQDRMIQLRFNENKMDAIKEAFSFQRFDLARALLVDESDDMAKNLIYPNAAFQQLIFPVGNPENFTLPEQLDFDLDTENSFGLTPLSLAMTMGNTAAIKVLLDRGAQIGTTFKNPKTRKTQNALGLAILSRDKAMLQLLLSYKQQVRALFQEEANSRPTETYVTLAMETKDLEIVAVLIEAGANVNNENSCRHCPLNIAIENNDEQLFDLLLPRTNLNGHSISPLTDAIEKSNLTMFRKLLDRGAQPLATHLFEACFKGQIEMARLLVERGDNVNARRNNGITALHLAKNAATAQFLLECGANQKMKLRNGDTPLHSAVRIGTKVNFEIVEALLVKEAPIHEKNKLGQTPLHLRARLAEGTILYVQKMIGLLVAAGADVNTRDKYQRTPLHDANRVPIARTLLEHGANPNLQDSHGDTPLHYAAKKRNLIKIQLLLQANAQIDIRNKQGFTPLHVALINDALDIAEFLLDFDQDFQPPNMESLLPSQSLRHKESLNQLLLRALRKGNHKHVQLLTQMGADHAVTPLDYVDPKRYRWPRVAAPSQQEQQEPEQAGPSSAHAAPPPAKRGRLIDYLESDRGKELSRKRTILGRPANSSPAKKPRGPSS